MKKLRKACALMIALAVMICAMPAFATVIYRDGETSDLYVNWMVYDGEKVYIMSYDGEYVTWTKDEGLSDVALMDRADYADPGEGLSTNIGGMVSSEGGLYAMVYLYADEYDEEEDYYSTWLEEAVLVRVEENSEGVMAFTDDRVEMEWDDMIESYDDSEYARDPQTPFITGDKLIFSTYTENGTGVGVYDITTGEGEVANIEIDASMEAFCEYKGGALLVTRDYTDISNPAMLHYFDPETLETEELGEIPAVDYNNPTALAYDEETDTLYFTLNGCLWAMPGLDAANATEICAVSTNSGSYFPAILTAEGDFISGDYSNIAVCSTDPADRPDASMTVYTGYNRYVDEAYFDFTTANSNIEIVKATSSGDIVQAMMNRDSSVDVYVLAVGDNAYKAVFERGFMAELNGSEKLTSLAGSMYPAMQDVVTKDGVVYGLPVSVYTGSGMSYDPQAFENAGLTEEDVPTTVMEMIKLFQRLPEIMAENEDMYAFQPYMTQEDVRYTMFSHIIGMYGQCMQAGYVDMQYNSELMRSILEEFEKIDFAAMGLSEDYDEDAPWISDDDHRVLFETYFDLTSQRYVLENSRKPLLLSIDEGIDPIIDAYVDVIFVNPYTENPELAVSFVEAVADSLDQAFLNELCPDMNEPVKNQYYEENLQYYEEELAAMNAELEKATDDETKEMWQAQIADMEAWRDEYTELYAWDVTEESLAFYRQYAGYLRPTFSLGLEGDASETYYDQIWQYIEGNITYDEMLRNIDDKLKMMFMEDM